MKRGLLPLNALRAFESTARLGKMGDAAEELGVTYSAISRQIRGLEKLLGVSLFDGPRNKLVPSENALKILPDLTKAFDRIEEVVNRLTSADKRPLIVSCLGTLTMRWLIPRLYDFQEKHPNIEVRITSDDGPVDFKRQQMDIAIRVGKNNWGDVNVIWLFDEYVGPVISPAIFPPEGLKKPNSLKGLPLLHTKTRPSAWSDWCKAVGITLQGEGKVYEHFYFMLEAATAGLGVAIAPEILVRDDLAAHRLTAPFGFLSSGQSYVALSPETGSADIRCFKKWLQSQVKPVYTI